MKKTLFLLLTAMSLSLPATAETVSEAMKKAIAAHEIAGAVTLLVGEKEILLASAHGLADIASQKPMTEDAVFWIASMTKPITATAVMMMQEEGKLSVDDPVSKYLPEFRSGDKAAITLKQCLTHSSGLSDLPREETIGVLTLTDLTPLIAAKPLAFPPGSKWSYCHW